MAFKMKGFSGFAKKAIKAIKKDFKAHDPLPNVSVGKDWAKATDESLKKEAKSNIKGKTKTHGPKY
jgi:hypothetical protein